MTLAQLLAEEMGNPSCVGLSGMMTGLFMAAQVIAILLIIVSVVYLVLQAIKKTELKVIAYGQKKETRNHSGARTQKFAARQNQAKSQKNVSEE